METYEQPENHDDLIILWAKSAYKWVSNDETKWRFCRFNFDSDLHQQPQRYNGSKRDSGINQPPIFKQLETCDSHGFL